MSRENIRKQLTVTRQAELQDLAKLLTITEAPKAEKPPSFTLETAILTSRITTML
jgi:hypothetical protein